MITLDGDISILKTLKHEMFEVNLRSDGIVHVHFYKNTKVDVALQTDMERFYNEITKVKRPFIMTAEEFLSVTSKARVNAREISKRVSILCSVLIVRNLAQKIIADYYMRFNKPVEPIYVEKDFDKGIAWIHENFKLSKL